MRIGPSAAKRMVIITAISISLACLAVASEPQDKEYQEFIEKSMQLTETWVAYNKSGPAGRRDEVLREKLQGQLANFLNVGMSEYPDSPETKRALDIYAMEAIDFASEMVSTAGDYRQAINRLEIVVSYYEAVGVEALPPLQEKILQLEEMRLEAGVGKGTSSLFRIVNVNSDDSLNIRSGPSPDSEIVGTIPYNATGVEWVGEQKTVRGRTKSFEWYKIRYAGVSGWVNSDFLKAQ